MKELIYDKNNMYDEDFYTIYFVNTNTKELINKLNATNIRVTSYIINDEKYYARNILELENKYLNDKSLEEKIYAEKYGIKIDGINAVSSVNELIKLENIIDIF